MGKDAKSAQVIIDTTKREILEAKKIKEDYLKKTQEMQDSELAKLEKQKADLELKSTIMKEQLQAKTQ